MKNTKQLLNYEVARMRMHSYNHPLFFSPVSILYEIYDPEFLKTRIFFGIKDSRISRFLRDLKFIFSLLKNYRISLEFFYF